MILFLTSRSLVLWLVIWSMSIQYSLCAQTLASGDVVVVGYNFTNPDDFSLLTLVDLPAGLQFYITDAGWDHQTMSFRRGEGLITYTVPIGGIKAGSQIIYPNDPGFVTQGMNGFFGLALAGDQLFIFQGAINNPAFIFGLSDYNGAWQNTTNIIDNQSSHLPASLQLGFNALALNHYVQAHFDCTHHFKDKQEFLAQLSNPINWVKTIARVYLPLSACDFSTLPLRKEWWYEWKSPHSLDLTVFNPPSSLVSWWVHQGEKQEVQLHCDFDGIDRYSCFVPHYFGIHFLLKPCLSLMSSEACGTYHVVERAHQLHDHYMLSMMEGKIEISWLGLADEVFYHVYDLSGKKLISSQISNADSFCIENLVPGCYVVHIIKEDELSRIKVCSTP